MATLYEINSAILDLIDLETGEILDPEKLESLQIDRKEKLRNIGFVALNAKADIQAYKEQEERFKAKRMAAEKTLAWAKETLQRELAGQKMKETEFSIYYSPSESVEVDEGAVIPTKFLKLQEPTIDKAGLKTALKNGTEIKGVRLVQKQNLQIR
jgi:hypothetical protein